MTYEEKDGYGRVCAAGPAAFEALVQTSVVMAQRYERGHGERIGRRSRSGVPLRL
ncbi:hypothetical protein CEB94_20010 [Streptomyces hawaiiensis]|uniref:Uncharacterized protein n=1 Tax=Streptomyces hawaiiensis TaxID=67305 RepID=A0A6G5RT01_9ACTN|nr:hypothetical protein CEB94_20010 [Streptomyces hawaiiensis]